MDSVLWAVWLGTRAWQDVPGNGVRPEQGGRRTSHLLTTSDYLISFSHASPGVSRFFAFIERALVSISQTSVASGQLKVET